MIGMEAAKMIRRLISHTDFGGGECWLWCGNLSRDGYGTISLNGGVTRRVHRVSAHLFFGVPLDDERLVLHTCDVRNCWNPDHLYMGCHADNMRDRNERGRSVGAGKGSRHHSAKLTEDVVADIKRRLVSGAKQRDIARDLGVSYKRVNVIATNKGWTHVPWPDERAA